MARPEITGKRSADNDADCYSIDEFCRRNRISVQLFYKFPKQMPTTFRIGTRRLVSKEAAQRWRREREQAGAQS